MSKEADLVDLSNLVRDYVDQEIPNVATWNINPDVLRTALALLGADFTLTDADVAAITAKYNANHNPDGSHVPPDEWIPEPATAVSGELHFISASSFTLAGDRRDRYRVGDRIRLHQSGSLVIVAITGVTFAGATSTTTLVVRTATTLAPVVSTLASIDRCVARDSLPRIGTFDLVDGAIDDPRILADQVVTHAKLADQAVDRDNLIDGEVVAGKLGPASVPTDALQDLAVTTPKLATAAVDSRVLAAVSVGSSHIQGGAVQNFHLALQAIFGLNIFPKTITTGLLADNLITVLQLAAGAVTTPKILDKNVTPAKLADEEYQTPTGNALAAATIRKSGWHFVTVGVSGRIFQRAITFPTPFPTALRTLRVFPLGLKIGSDPTHIGDSVNTRTVTDTGTSVENMILVNPQGGSLSLAGFTAVLAPNLTSTPATGNLQTGDRLLFGWEATGA